MSRDRQAGVIGTGFGTDLGYGETVRSYSDIRSSSLPPEFAGFARDSRTDLRGYQDINPGFRVCRMMADHDDGRKEKPTLDRLRRMVPMSVAHGTCEA